MDELERRIIQLEVQGRAERERTDYHLAGLYRRVEGLETRPDTLTRVMGAGGWLKILIAICLPLLVLLATGDWHAAVRAARLSGG